jgi:dolichol kinase
LAKRRKALDSVHKIEPDNFGAVLFPLGLIPCALLFWGNPIVFQSSVLVLGFSDGLACIFGRQYGKHGYNVTGPKTAEGSLVFFMTTLIIFILAALYSQQEMNLTKTSYLVLGSLAVTIVEGAFGKGWDNLFVPLSAGFAAQLVLPG